MPDFSIGVDLGGTNLRIAAVSVQGELLEKVAFGSKGSPRERVIECMCAAIRQLSEKYRGMGKVIGVGIGVPGIIDLETGTMRKSANLPGWEEYPVQAEVERRLGARVVVENDAKAAALGELWLGAARGVANAAMLTLGTGIGGAIIFEGKVWHGLNGLAGEFGHVTLEPEGVPCGCGNRGCAERYASASAILRMAREAIATGKAPALEQVGGTDGELGAQAIYDLAMRGDEQAQSIFRSFGRYLGILLAGMVNVLDLEVYVIGGGVASAWDTFAPDMFAELRARSIVYAASGPKDPMRDALESENKADERRTIITRALLGSDAGLYGAAHLAARADQV